MAFQISITFWIQTIRKTDKWFQWTLLSAAIVITDLMRHGVATILFSVWKVFAVGPTMDFLLRAFLPTETIVITFLI